MQGDQEKKLGLPVSPLSDRSVDNGNARLASSQIGFIDFVVRMTTVYFASWQATDLLVSVWMFHNQVNPIVAPFAKWILSFETDKYSSVDDLPWVQHMKRNREYWVNKIKKDEAMSPAQNPRSFPSNSDDKEDENSSESNMEVEAEAKEDCVALDALDSRV